MLSWLELYKCFSKCFLKDINEGLILNNELQKCILAEGV